MIPLRKKRYYILTIIALLILTVSYFTQRQLISCHLIEYQSFNQVAPNIFTSPSVSNPDNVLFIIEQSKQRIAQMFGPTIATPRVVIVNTKEEAASLGANRTGSTIYSPFGTCVILGPKGQNVDVAAHELFHAEVWHRVGWYNHFRQFPIWLNEGIALWVDHRKPFLPENIEVSQQEIDDVKSAFSSQEFFNTKQMVKRYQSARMATADINPTTFYQKLERLAQGENFQTVFGF